jgi:hypothetical protein
MSTTAARQPRTSGQRISRPTLANYWHPIARSEDVGEQPKQFELLDEKSCAFRTTAGSTTAREPA